MNYVYTERFLAVSTPDTWLSYTCPAGKRAVVMTAILANGAATTASIAVLAGTAVVYQGTVPAHTTVILDQLRLAVYGTEPISAHVTPAGAYAAVAGYLFTDPIAGAAAPPAVAGEPPEWFREHLE